LDGLVPVFVLGVEIRLHVADHRWRDLVRGQSLRKLRTRFVDLSQAIHRVRALLLHLEGATHNRAKELPLRVKSHDYFAQNEKEKPKTTYLGKEQYNLRGRCLDNGMLPRQLESHVNPRSPLASWLKVDHLLINGHMIFFLNEETLEELVYHVEIVGR